MLDPRELWNSRYARKQTQQLQPDPWLARWLPLIAPAREGRVLDLGCGDGRTCRYLAEAGFRQLVAADLSDEALRLCRQTVPQATQLQLDLREPLPFADEQFRVIIASLCLHYFPWSLTQQIVREIHRCVQTNGDLFVRLNSTHDVNHGAGGYPEIEPGLLLVENEPKRFFDHESVERLFAEGWKIRACEELTIETRSMSKMLWEVVMRKSWERGHPDRPQQTS